jgi:NAD-dependent DNA ligase
MEESILAKFGGDRISSRQIDELIGLARGLVADGMINQMEVEFLQKWLVANGAVSDQPIIRTLYKRIDEILADGILDDQEMNELLDTLGRFANRDFELGEVLKSTSLPLNSPPPPLSFHGHNYCFTGTFNFGNRRHCEEAVIERGAQAGGLSKKTTVLVIGVYATDSWKHSAFGNKILNACEWRDLGLPIVIVSEEHWVKYL